MSFVSRGVISAYSTQGWWICLYHCNLNVITVILSSINSLSLSYPVSSRPSTLLLILSLQLLSSAISLPSHALSTGSESMNAPNTSSSHLPTKFLQLHNLHTFITSSLFNVLAVLALHPSLTLLGYRHHPLILYQFDICRRTTFLPITSPIFKILSSQT